MLSHCMIDNKETTLFPSLRKKKRKKIDELHHKKSVADNSCNSLDC